MHGETVKLTVQYVSEVRITSIFVWLVLLPVTVFTPWTLCLSNDIRWWSSKYKPTCMATWGWKQRYIQKRCYSPAGLLGVALQMAAIWLWLVPVLCCCFHLTCFLCLISYSIYTLLSGFSSLLFSSVFISSSKVGFLLMT